MMPALANVLAHGISIDAAIGARLASQLYTLAITSTIPMIVAVAIAALVRQTPAGTRALVWRSVALAIPVVCAGNVLSLHAVTAVVPDALAAPLVALGRLQLSDATGIVSSRLADGNHLVPATGANIVWLLLSLWLVGALGVACWMAAGWHAMRVALTGSATLDGDWSRAAHEATEALGVSREVAIRVADVAVPMTSGVLRPVIVVPRAALDWSADTRRTVLLHEMAHVRAGDLAFALVARLSSVVLWFHPGIWWISHQLRSECEHAADDRVLSSGVRASDYAELLIVAANAAFGRSALNLPVLALSRHGGLRGRLTSIVDTSRDRRAPLRRTMAFAVAVTVVVAAPSATLRLAPTREVLPTLMRDARWESRAYAVIGLAQRADSVEVARAAAEGDPNPRVRAWARLALLQSGVERGTPLAAPSQRVSPDAPISALPSLPARRRTPG
ncbi:MAG: M56 family metallopeptidase [Gemmatimonadaceae bacterium]